MTQAQSPAAAGQLSRVTLAGARRRIDLVLPADEPLGLLLPEIVAMVGHRPMDDSRGYRDQHPRRHGARSGRQPATGGRPGRRDATGRPDLRGAAGGDRARRRRRGRRRPFPEVRPLGRCRPDVDRHRRVPARRDDGGRARRPATGGRAGERDRRRDRAVRPPRRAGGQAGRRDGGAAQRCSDGDEHGARADERADLALGALGCRRRLRRARRGHGDGQPSRRRPRWRDGAGPGGWLGRTAGAGHACRACRGGAGDRVRRNAGAPAPDRDDRVRAHPPRRPAEQRRAGESRDGGGRCRLRAPRAGRGRRGDGDVGDARGLVLAARRARRLCWWPGERSAAADACVPLPSRWWGW